MNKKNILITGAPSVGKTTLIQKVLGQLQKISMAGFFTSDIRIHGKRVGFELVSLEGKKSTLARSDIKNPSLSDRVGKYYVNVSEFENFIDTLSLLETQNDLIIIDEIGKMECLSEKFKNIVQAVFDSDKVVCATIALKGEGLIKEMKNRHDTVLFEVTKENRELLLIPVLEHINKALNQK